jgi:alkylation response protein AidB-like acyl-CoA dehydrogenase
MDFNYSDLQRMLLDSAERYIAERFTLEHRRSLRDSANGADSGLDAEAWATFAELGWLALAVPEALGGLGGSPADVAVLAAALGNKCVSQPFVGTAVQGVHLLAAAATPQTDLIEQIVGGAARVALVHGEPGERYAGPAPRQTTLAADGAGLVLSGQKFFAPDAPLASHLVVSAQLAGTGLALVLVEAGGTGITADAYPLLDGSRAADLRFDAVPVAAEAVLATGSAVRGGHLLGRAGDRGLVGRDLAGGVVDHHGAGAGAAGSGRRSGCGQRDTDRRGHCSAGRWRRL